ncbi:MAG: hypothetical protein AB7O97_18095 [Planctomycetota bacterium]
MNVDRDLPDALRPLRGDPVADAARVLAALPPGPPAGAPRDPGGRPWLPWALLGLGLLAGGAVGYALGGGAAAPAESTERPDARPPEPSEQPAKEPEPTKEPDKEKEPDKQPQPVPFERAEMREMLYVMAFGPIDVDEPGFGAQGLARGEWRTKLGSQFRTGPSQAGVYVYANDARMRIDRETAVRIAADRVQLEFGRAWVDTGDMSATLRVECDGVTAALETPSGAQFTRGPSGVQVLALRGKVSVRADGTALLLKEHQSVFVDADMGAQPVEDVAFTAPATSWMTDMIVAGTDPNELRTRVERVIAAYEDGAHRDAARREILKLGARCVWMLADSIERRAGDDPAYARDAAALAMQLVDFGAARHALPLLRLDDVELRALVFRGVRDATGTDGGTDEAFWREAELPRRQRAIEHWIDELNR